MSVNPRLPDYETWSEQECPFCKVKMPMVARGFAFMGQDAYPVPDRGYSFCNCKNIFFTDWSNIDQTSYTAPMYEKDHLFPQYGDQIEQLFNFYIKPMEQIGNGGKKLLDLGAVVNFLLNPAKKRGYETYGWDIIEHKDFGHEQIVGNFDTITTDKKFDIIFSNHFFEHIKDPLGGLAKCYSMLNPGGILFISMPDPFQITWDNPSRWGNFILRQHYIIWDMESFCDEAEKVGFTTKLKKRNFDVRPLRDYHLMFVK